MGKYSVRVERREGTATIRLGGDIDQYAGPAVRSAVADVILGEPSARLVFDMADTTFADPTAMNALTLAHHAALMSGATIEVTSNPMVDRVLERMGMAALLGSRPQLVAAG